MATADEKGRPFDPLTQCLTCGEKLVTRPAKLELSYGKIDVMEHYCGKCDCARTDPLPGFGPLAKQAA